MLIGMYVYAWYVHGVHPLHIIHMGFFDTIIY